MPLAVGYIRRSNPGESKASIETQREAITRLAAQHGYSVAHVFQETGQSGGSETRPKYLAMLERIDQGGVDAVLAYDQDRLCRSSWLWAGLQRLARQRLARQQPFAIWTLAGNLADPKMRVMAGVKSYLDEAELDLDKERAQVNAANRRARKDDDGPAPYGYRRERQTMDGRTLPPLLAGQKAGPGERFVFVVDDAAAIARVVDLYRETRSLNETARRLNADKVPADRGGAWHAPSVAHVLDRNAPELRDGVKGRGVRAYAKPRLLSRVLRCHCGRVMSPADARRGVRWYCRQAVVGMHGGQRGITEAKLLPLVKAEAAHLRTPAEVLLATGSDYDDSAARGAAEALRGQVADDIVKAALADLDAKRAAATGHQEVVRAVPAIDWSRPVADVNAALKALFVMHLGDDLLPGRTMAEGEEPRPTTFDWHVPDWRGD